jgi:hypothetical protein
MQRILAKTTHPGYAVVAYTIVTAITIAGLIVSSGNMFFHFAQYSCLPGSVTVPYNGTNAPNADRPDQAPFCNKANLLNLPSVTLNYGFAGISEYLSNQFIKASYGRFILFFQGSTCLSLKPQNANSLSAQLDPLTNQISIVSDYRTIQFWKSINVYNDVTSFSKFNNFPVKVSAATVSGITYYARNFHIDRSTSPFALTGAFQLATSVDSTPIKKPSFLDGDTFTAEFPSISNCASQASMLDSTINASEPYNVDGTLKKQYQGICVTDDQASRLLAVPGLVITTIILQLLLCISMCISRVRSLRFFNLAFAIVNLVCIVFLIAAVGSAATLFLSNLAPCIHLTDFSDEQIKPSPTSNGINGFIPSSGGFSLASLVDPSLGKWTSTQAGNAAAYATMVFLPGGGAALLSAAILIMFIFAIVFCTKTTWTTSDPSASFALSPEAFNGDPQAIDSTPQVSL